MGMMIDGLLLALLALFGLSEICKPLEKGRWSRSLDVFRLKRLSKRDKLEIVKVLKLSSFEARLLRLMVVSPTVRISSGTQENLRSS